MSDTKNDVSLTAVDSFHSSQTGTISARAQFTTHRAHADDLVKKGLAVEAASKQAEEPANKKAPEHANKKAAEPSNKAKK